MCPPRALYCEYKQKPTNCSEAILHQSEFVTVICRILVNIYCMRKRRVRLKRQLEIFLRKWRLGLLVASWSRSTKLLYTPGPVSTEMGDRLWAGKPPWFVTNHSGQLSLLPSPGRKISTGQSAVTLCGWRVNAGMVHYTFYTENVWVAGKTV